MNYITAYARIQNKSISFNGKRVWGNGVSFPEFLSEAYANFGIDYPKFYKMDPLSKAGFVAAEVMLRDGNISGYSSTAIGLVLSNAHASLDTDKRYIDASAMVPSPALFVYTLPNIVAGEICIRHRIKGENAFFISESFDEELLFEYVEMVLAQRNTEACISGWIDVLGEHHDVLVYLVEKKSVGLSLVHTAEQLRKFY